MSTTLIWPESLPQRFLRDGYSEQPPDLTISSQPDAGPFRPRRRFSAGVRPIQGNVRCSNEQLTRLLSFYEHDLLSGSLRFQWKEPRDDTKDVEMMFSSVPEATCVRGFFLVSLSLVILP